MRNSNLWRSIEPHIKVQKRVEVLQALEHASQNMRNNYFFDNTKNLISIAFVWSATPQGHAYWSDIALEIEQAKRRAAERPQVRVEEPIQAQPRARARAQVPKPEAKKSNVVRIPAD